jgi:hypothetical protein
LRLRSVSHFPEFRATIWCYRPRLSITFSESSNTGRPYCHSSPTGQTYHKLSATTVSASDPAVTCHMRQCRLQAPRPIQQRSSRWFPHVRPAAHRPSAADPGRVTWLCDSPILITVGHAYLPKPWMNPIGDQNSSVISAASSHKFACGSTHGLMVSLMAPPGQQRLWLSRKVAMLLCNTAAVAQSTRWETLKHFPV